jgi:ATP-dependent DNA helicase RecG
MPRADELHILPADELIEVLTKHREDQWLERTSARSNARHIGDLLAGFANAEGGIVVIGIEQGRIEGVSSAGAARMNEWRQAALDFTKPPVRHKFETIQCTTWRGNRDELAVIQVEASDRVHTNVKEEVFLRVGDENRRLGVLQAQELRYDKGESVFDGSLVAGEADLFDLNEELVTKYIRAVGARSETDVVLRARGLAAQQRGRIRPTVAGILVLGRNPLAEFPQAYVRLLRYKGSARETGTRSNVLADRKLEGPIPVQIDTARRTLRRWIPSVVRLRREGRFARTTLIPEFVWLEAVINAVTHRSYSIGGDHIRVELFDDRLEVTSPGRLPGLVRLDNIRSTRFARNPRIARALSDLGYGRELGEGVNRMFEEMHQAGLPEPIYGQGPASLTVILLADPLARRILARLPRGSERFVEFLSRTGRVTTAEAAELLGTSRPTARAYLYELADQELVEHVATSARDPRGFWRLRPASRM